MRILTVPLKIFSEIWLTFSDASPYILFGILIAGLIQAFVDKDRISRHLGKPGFKSVFWAGIFGVPLPLCSCGVVPTAVSLRKNGAAKGAVLAFLISTPETGIDSIAISYALLDPLMTVFRPVTAFVTALTAGVMENLFGKKETAPPPLEDICVFCEKEGHNHSHTVADKIKYGLRYGFTELLGDVALWLTLGIIISGLISYFVPQTLIERTLGSDWRSMLVILAVSIPLYICASASTPIAAALIAKGMSPGTALVFLIAGPATNMAGILAVAKFLGKRSAVIYLVSISVCAVVFGLLLNWIYAVSGINITSVLGQARDILPDYLKTGCAALLILLMLRSVHKRSCQTGLNH